VSRSRVTLAVSTALCAGCGTLLGADAPIEIEEGGTGDGAAPRPDAYGALDTGAPPVGLRIVAGANLQLPAVPETFTGFLPPPISADGYLPYADVGAGLARVVRLAAGSAPVDVAPLDAGGAVMAMAQGSSLLIWLAPPVGSGFGALYSFSPTTGVTRLSQDAPLGNARSSADGTRIAVWDRDGAGQYRLSVTNVDGTHSTELVSSVPYATERLPILGFAGSYADRLLAAWCIDAACSEVALHWFFLGRTPPLDRYLGSIEVTFQPSLVTDPSGRWLAAAVLTTPPPAPGASRYHMSVFDVAAGAETVIDSEVTSVGYVSGGPGGEAISYLTPSAYKQSTITSVAPVTLQPGTFTPGIIFPSSPDGTFTLLSHTYGGTVDYDLILAPASQPGPATTLVAESAAGFRGNPWTADGSHALWADSSMEAVSVRDGTRKIVDTEVWRWWPLTFAKVAVAAHGTASLADLIVHDLASSPVAELLRVSDVTGFFPTPDGSQIVYARGDGIWLVDVP
jgi:hypothetical protein